ncbi:tetratricopeptide repeat protein [Aliiruegeria lutimaris]|uniref:Flp pilus assembly protein TadD, contains TPR repeats n=1 Tax=Aliiruegeria lutimaris TaxID=571298 RepID=A0A1G8XEE3_9RHOB|nr:tetratricopeptide repeat protein [Aliiruegeria lutimaris]SDJ88989.1 Flp pilus assembly protein TadD, contains TPR repeats [Aliiruegeria lutimaris]
MRQITLVTMCLGAAMALSACEKAGESEVDRAIQSVNVIDESNLSDLMLTAADANEAVAYYKRTVAEHPERIDLQRNLAKSLVRAKHNTEATAAWAKVVAMPEATNSDSVDYADALIRAGDWDKAEATLDKVPPTHETFKRYKLEAMVADGNKEWKKADSFYEIAVGLTTKPATTLNNWGYSKLTRGDYREAERLFGEALQYEPDLYTAKNNLVLARGAQRNYQLPIVEMTQTERAQLLHTAGLTAIKHGDTSIGRSLLQDAIDTHPQHFEAAVHSLNALDGV